MYKYDAIAKMLEEMGSKNIKLRNFEITASCPFAPYSHLHGEDRHPSFGINMAFGVYNCFSCSSYGTLNKLIKEYCSFSGEPSSKYYKYLQRGDKEYCIDMEKLARSKSRINKDIDVEIKADEFMEYNEYKFMYNDFLRSKGIEPSSARVWELACTPLKVIFPIKSDNNKKILGFVYRNILYKYDKNMPKYTFTEKFPKSIGVFGLNKVSFFNGPIVIVEGILDTIYMNQMGINAVGIFGTHMSDEQAEKIKAYNPSNTIGVLFDDDEAGRIGSNQVKETMSRWFKVVSNVTSDIRSKTFDGINNLLGGILCREKMVVF